MENHANTGLIATGNFIHQYIHEDLGENLHRIHTRFPPEPNGYLHIGHAKAICISFGMAALYGGKCNLRFDDTNPAKEDATYVAAIIEDIKWLGFDWEDRLYHASDYFDKLYECAVTLIKNGKAFVCDMTADEVKESRGTLNTPGVESPYRNRSVEENLDLFTRMKNGEFPDGARTLRAKIDMASANMNMRDPVIYRIAHLPHHNTGDKWCIYPMYDYAHPLEDAIEKITHSLCSLEFEDHRPIYNWYVNETGFDPKPRQIEFAKLNLTNTIMGKRYMRALVESGRVDGWDDPRLMTLSGIRRRGVRPEAVRAFCDMAGVSKANSVVDIAMYEYCVREDLKPRAKTIMAVLDPLKITITNFPEGQTEMLPIENNAENPELGERLVPFSRVLYVERDDFMEDAPKKFFRLSVGREVRLKGAYFITCNEVVKDESGRVVALHCTYDPETKSGSGFTGRKVKGTIHWVSAPHAARITARLFDYLEIDDPEAEGGTRENPDSLIIMRDAVAEPSIRDATEADRFQFLRHGYFALDSKLTSGDDQVFNRIVSLKSSYKPE